MRPHRALNALLALALTPLLAGCDLFPAACTLNIVPGIVVTITDSVTGAPVADSASGIVTEAAYTDSLRPHGFTSTFQLLSRHAAQERAGTYSVLVTHPRFQNWSASSVRVDEDECHVQTVTLDARMAP